MIPTLVGVILLVFLLFKYFGGDPAEILALHELLTDLEKEDSRKASIVSMKFFGGMTAEEIAAVLGTSARTVERDWRFARAWMQKRWGERDEGVMR